MGDRVRSHGHAHGELPLLWEPALPSMETLLAAESPQVGDRVRSRVDGLASPRNPLHFDIIGGERS